MSHLYNQIKEDQLEARKNSNEAKVKILTYLLGEVGRQKTQDFSDKAVYAVLKTTVKRLKAAQELSNCTKEDEEIEVLSEYLPKELGGVELKARLLELSFSSKGEAMRQIKQWGVAVDMKQASNIISEILS